MFVPCGKCFECQQQKQNEWFVRNYFQWQSQPANTSFFYTLTYNNESVPKFSTKWSVCLVFSKRHITLFLKRLRKRLLKIGITLRYMVTSEYGEKYKRPHYHALFYLSCPVNPFVFYKMVEDAWQYGFVKYGENVGVISDMRGIRYVTKYVTKDMSFMLQNSGDLIKYVYNRYIDLLNYLNNRYDLHMDWTLYVDLVDYTFRVRHFDRRYLSKEHPHYEFSQTFLEKVRSQFKKFQPFHLQSTNLGAAKLEELTDYEKDSEYIRIFNKDGSFKEYPLPRYYRRKLWYDAVENENDGKLNSFVLNKHGIQHHLDSLDAKINRKQEQYTNALLLASKATIEDVQAVNRATGLSFVKPIDLTYFLQHLDIDLRKLAIYDIVFKGRVNYFNNKYLTSDMLLSNYHDIVKFHLTASANYDMGRVCEMDREQFERYVEPYLFEKEVFFSVYHTTSLLLDAFAISQRFASVKAKEYRETLARKTREVFNKLN